MTDFAKRRTMMVDNQVRPSDVTKYPIIEALLHVERERFVPSDLREAAYLGENLSLSKERVLLDPRTFAKMLDAAEIDKNDMVLDLGIGLGYSAAVIARMAEAVIGVEDDERLAQEAITVLSEAGSDNVVVETGDLSAGAPQHGPYDVITFEGAVHDVPQAILDQLKEGGRLVSIFAQGNVGTVKVGHKIGGDMSWRFAFNGTAPVLAGFERQDEFSL